MSYHEEDNSGKILLAALAGAGAGIIAGMLMAPDKGKATRDNLKNAATKYSGQLGEQLSKYGEQLDTQFKGYMEKLEDLGITGAGSGLKLKGSWDEAKGKLRQQYAQLTDDDLNYVEGQEDDLLGRLQQKLGKGKKEITKILNDL
ncbi:MULTISPECIES: YtxH domain-containing protein [Hymenobacter]|uniref:CsbD family protein n=1 Tax=Hymenobacter jejuensis TaxID=2502781 RepID=A0A5B7ZXQ2_9BACT|nr:MULTISPECIES: YtxH domain-containing protein [Hymenobacter]MBC6988363.1 CsbD family protein [Hymenobacter sp. BT491]QDA59286.1 CsbD family protein [Hymenobacter jejuensis]